AAAAQAAIAMETARLYEDARRQAQLLELTADVSKALASSIDLEQTLALVARNLARLVDASACQIALAEEDGGGGCGAAAPAPARCSVPRVSPTRPPSPSRTPGCTPSPKRSATYRRTSSSSVSANGGRRRTSTCSCSSSSSTSAFTWWSAKTPRRTRGWPPS